MSISQERKELLTRNKNNLSSFNRAFIEANKNNSFERSKSDFQLAFYNILKKIQIMEDALIMQVKPFQPIRTSSALCVVIC